MIYNFFAIYHKMRKLTSKYMDKYFLGFFFLQQNMTYNNQLETPWIIAS